jgi:hypothetical protein
MKSLVIPTMALLLALSVPALAQDRNSGGTGTSTIRGAPGPLVGAGLPVLLIGGGIGIYWLVRRRKGQARTP